MPIIESLDRGIIEESCSSAFFSEEGTRHLNESSFSSMNEETPTLEPKKIGRTPNLVSPINFTLRNQGNPDYVTQYAM